HSAGVSEGGGAAGQALADPSSRRSLLQQLQALIKQTSTKAAQTSTCILVRHAHCGTPASPGTARGHTVLVPPRQILLFSLGLILFPSYSPFRRGPGGSRAGDRPTG
ncbi:CR3L4 protein, partial [Thalassarche chlororhynchos]|nr:CR3L4 protein [Thalassarche chlororhynchos]